MNILMQEYIVTILISFIILTIFVGLYYYFKRDIKPIESYLKLLPIIFVLDIFGRLISLSETTIFPLYVLWFLRYLIPKKEENQKFVILFSILFCIIGIGYLLNSFQNSFQSLLRNINKVFEDGKEIFKNINYAYLVIAITIMVIQRILYALTWVNIVSNITNKKLAKSKILVTHAVTELTRYTPVTKYLTMPFRVYVFKKQGIPETNTLLAFMYEKKYNVLSLFLITIVLFNQQLFAQFVNQTGFNFLDKTLIFMQLFALVIIIIILLINPNIMNKIVNYINLKILKIKDSFVQTRRSIIVNFFYHILLSFMYVIGYGFLQKSLFNNIQFDLSIFAFITFLGIIAGMVAGSVGRAFVYPIRITILASLIALTYPTDVSVAYAALGIAFNAFIFYVVIILYQIVILIFARINKIKIKDLISDIRSFRKNESK